MIDVPRQTLSKIIAKHGVSLCVDARRCEALLRDLCPAYRREINILTGALEERVAVELLALRNGQGAMPREMLLSRLVRRLEDHLALTSAAAQWAVDSWALALGVVSEAEVEAREKKAEKDRLSTAPLPSSDDATNKAQATNATTVKSPPPPSPLSSKPSSSTPPSPPPQSKSSTPAARQPTNAPASTRPKSGGQIFPPAPVVKSSPPQPTIQPRTGKRVFPPSLITPIIDPSRRKRRGGIRGCLLGCVVIVALLASMFFVVPAVITYLRQEQQRSRENFPPRSAPVDVPAAQEIEPPSSDHRRLRASIIEIVGDDERSRVDGFFVSRNEIIAPVSALQAALRNGERARIEGRNGMYVIERTIGIDRQHGLARLRVRRTDGLFDANPVSLTINDEPTLASGQTVTVVRSFRDDANLSDPRGVIGNQRDGLIEVIADGIDTINAGRPVLNQRGEVVAVIVRTRVGNARAHLAVPATFLVRLFQR